MKKKLLVLCSAAVLCISAVFPSYAAKVIYSDGTVYDSSVGSSDSSASSASSETVTGSSSYVPDENSSYPQPPAKELSEYQLPLTVVYIKSSGRTFVYSEPTTSSSPVPNGLANAGEMYRLIEDTGDFYKVLYDGGEAYIPKSDNTELRTTIMMDAGMEKRAEIVTNAFNYLGSQYVYAGDGSNGTFDCSGFTAKVMADAGVYLPHSSSAQASCGTQIDASDLRPGDLVFFSNGDSIESIYHVAMYIGNGMLIHGFGTGSGVRVDRFDYEKGNGIAPYCYSNVLGDQN